MASTAVAAFRAELAAAAVSKLGTAGPTIDEGSAGEVGLSLVGVDRLLAEVQELKLNFKL